MLPATSSTVTEASIEGRLMIAALRSRHDAAATDELAALVAEVDDWDAALWAARTRRMTLFIRDAILRADLRDRLPAEVWERLDANYRDAVAITLVARQALEAAITALGDARHLVLRGPVLGELLYGPELPRPFQDLDLLIDTRRSDALWEIATQLSGGRVFHARWTVDLDLNEFLVRSSQEITTDQAAELDSIGTLISLHLEIVEGVEVDFKPGLSRGYKTRMDIDAAWAERVEVDWLGLRTAMPAPELMLPHLADHAAYHPEPDSKLLAIADIDALVRATPDLDWARAADRIRELSIELPCTAAFLTAKRLLGTPFPEEWLQEIMPQGRAKRVLEDALTRDIIASTWGPLTPYALIREVAKYPSRWAALGLKRQVRRMARVLAPSPGHIRWQWCAGRPGPGLLRGYLRYWLDLARLAGRERRRPDVQRDRDRPTQAG